MCGPYVSDLGLHLKGEPRIQFLLDKMKEIRKVYQSIRSEVAAIDRKRKRARRREKERESKWKVGSQTARCIISHCLNSGSVSIIKFWV